MKKNDHENLVYEPETEVSAAEDVANPLAEGEAAVLKKRPKGKKKEENDEPMDPKTAKKKKVNKVINIVVNVILIIAIVFAVICTYVSFVTTSGNGVPSIFGLRLLSIQTPSMKPTINDGDLAIATSVEPAELRPKDIITYWTVINGERVLNTHRIENIYDGGGYLIFETKGDANTSVDILTVHEKEIVGKYQWRIPGVGKVFDYLQTGTGFFIVVVIPVFIFFIFHLVQFFRALFEYQNVKNRIKFEKERAEAEGVPYHDSDEEAAKAAERAALEAEIREQLRREMLEAMAKEQTEKEPADDSAENADEAEQ